MSVSLSNTPSEVSLVCSLILPAPVSPQFGAKLNVKIERMADDLGGKAAHCLHACEEFHVQNDSFLCSGLSKAILQAFHVINIYYI